MSASKNNPSQETSPQSLPDSGTLYWCLHKGPSGKFDCSELFRSATPRRLCPKHAAVRVRL